MRTWLPAASVAPSSCVVWASHIRADWPPSAMQAPCEQQCREPTVPSCSGVVLACLLIECRLFLQVRADGGISPLVRLLNSWDLKVQRAAAGALRTLAFKNDDNKRQIVECGALPLLIQVRRQGEAASATRQCADAAARAHARRSSSWRRLAARPDGHSSRT